jgi:hypothetical protein
MRDSNTGELSSPEKTPHGKMPFSDPPAWKIRKMPGMRSFVRGWQTVLDGKPYRL